MDNRTGGATVICYSSESGYKCTGTTIGLDETSRLCVWSDGHLVVSVECNTFILFESTIEGDPIMLSGHEGVTVPSEDE